MNSRERVLRAVGFEETDRVPMDLAGMPSTGISCFAYPSLIAELNLPARLPRVYDTGQMLALPEPDVLDALGIDVITLTMDYTNAFDEPEKWHPYDFGGRLPALVRDPNTFRTLSDGTVVQNGGSSKMPPAAHVFESEHGGQPFVLSGDLPKPDLREVEADNRKWQFSNEEIDATARYFERVRAASDRAILFCGPGAGLGIGAYYGIAMFPMLCLAEPDFVAQLHEITIHYAIERAQALLKVIHPFIDVYQCSSDDWGTQNQTFASPTVFDELFRPYYRRFTDALHASGPHVKTFLHSCGAIYDILDLIVDSGFDILNPVQWTAGGHSYREWKDKARGRIALWGGGVNTQATLPLGTLEDIEREVREVVDYMRRDGGFVFCAIHNLLAEIPGGKVAALYRACRACG